ncbi:hypothetical protein Zmor_014065 [Zophobas morio]|uniref:Uncharacterized protein n=1 Tax=Zophobas morio TaxID=2755281 RepID=A0AA38IBH6_9CUCU|nr:hypothetical protein Zmor_014065 [Zophobas morio]
MADNSWDVDTIMDFHPCNIPHGMKNYVLQDLTPDQQTKLNVYKREQIRTDQKYLAAHPEIRGLIIMILRLLLKTKPVFDIYEVVGQYFTKSSVDLKEEIYAYLEEREQILSANSFAAMIHQKDLSLSLYLEQEGEQYEGERYEEEPSIKDEKESISLEESYEYHDEEESKRKEFEIDEDRISVNICREVLDEILELVHDEVDNISLASIESADLVDYEDHDIGSTSDESVD